MKFHIIIPARLESTRLPEKLLCEIADKTMLEHTFNAASRANPSSIIIATDNQKIAQVADSFGASICLTKPSHQSGSERIAEAIDILNIDDEDIIVNLQGDEPLTPATTLQQVAMNLAMHETAAVATLCQPFNTYADLVKSEHVKVVFDKQGFALYFSRSPIPWQQQLSQQNFIPGMHFLHIGIYAYRAGFLRKYFQLERTPLEQMEILEQLRILWHGHKIHVDIANAYVEPGVNTANDLERVRRYCAHMCV